jgi:hypothetical protein
MGCQMNSGGASTYGTAQWHLFPASQQAFAASRCRSTGIDIPEPVVDCHYTTELAEQYDMPPTSVGKRVKPLKLPMYGEYRLTTTSHGNWGCVVRSPPAPAGDGIRKGGHCRPSLVAWIVRPRRTVSRPREACTALPEHEFLALDQLIGDRVSAPGPSGDYRRLMPGVRSDSVALRLSGFRSTVSSSTVS